MKNDSLKRLPVVRADGVAGKITYGLRYLKDNRDAYFTVTAWFDDDSGGCCHDEVLRLAPQLAPLVALHLSDEETGQPMHLYANAEFHAGVGKYSQFAPRCLAEHLRISDEVADDLANAGNREQLRTFIASQLTRYRDEARAAIKAFGLREGGQE